MIFNFFNRKEIAVLVLYKFETVEVISGKEFDDVINFLSKIMDLNKAYLAYFDIKYKDFGFEAFKTGEKKIRKKFNNLISFSVSDVNPLKYKPNIYFTFSRSCNSSYLTLEFAKNLVPTEDILTLVNLIKPLYGFVYETKQSDNSTKFATEGYSRGMPKIKGLKKFEEPKGYFRENITKLKDGFLREIFPINFVTDKQLTKTVDGRTLLDYISKEKIGTIRNIDPDTYVWELSEDDKLKAGVLPGSFHLQADSSI